MERGPWDRILEWIEKVLPTAIASFALGFKRGQNEKNKVEAKLAKTEYELEKMQNAETVRKENDGKSPRAIVDEYMQSRKGKGE